MVGYANIYDMKIWCDLAEFVERNYVSFIVNVNGKFKCFKKYVRFSNESKSLYVNILGTRIFYEDFVYGYSKYGYSMKILSTDILSTDIL